MNKYISFIDYGPTPDEIIERDKLKKCTSIKFNKDGETYFFCNNKANPYIIDDPPLKNPIYLWISQSMICDNCLFKLSRKYSIDFKKEIPRLYLEKGSHKYIHINYKETPLIKELEEGCGDDHNTDFFFNPEIRWFKEIHFIFSIPIRWLTDFKLINSNLKGSKRQGNFNGPDYIFQDTKTNEKIGFEITSYKWNLFETFKNINHIKNFSIKKLFNTFSFDERIEEFKKIVIDKSNKKYLETDKLFLGIVVNNVLVDYECYVIELILNKWIKEEKIKLDGVFIM